MKFLCVECDNVMDFAERQLPGDGTLAAVFSCGSCGREVAMLTNPMETQLVSSLGIKIGGREVPAQPLEMVRSSLEGGERRPSAYRRTSPDSRPSKLPRPVRFSGAPRRPSGCRRSPASSEGW